MKQGIYKFYAELGREGNLEGLFVATKQQIQDIMNKEIDFGSVLGKHSDIVLDISEDHIKLISDDPKDILFFNRLKLNTGINPVKYWIDNNQY